MKTLSQAFFPVTVTVAVLSIGIQSVAMAGTNRQHSYNQCCIPKRYNYGRDTPRFGNTRFAVATTVVGDKGQRRKPFHFRATSLTVDHLVLDQVGLAIYEADGKLMATGRITHSGGDGGLIGNNVKIRIRAYVTPTGDVPQIPADADASQAPADGVVVRRWEHNVWIPRNRPQYISLVPEPKCGPKPTDSDLPFDDITYLEVEMEYLRDR